jgi:hypothetical protein
VRRRLPPRRHSSLSFRRAPPLRESGDALRAVARGRLNGRKAKRVRKDRNVPPARRRRLTERRLAYVAATVAIVVAIVGGFAIAHKRNSGASALALSALPGAVSHTSGHSPSHAEARRIRLRSRRRRVGRRCKPEVFEPVDDEVGADRARRADRSAAAEQLRKQSRNAAWPSDRCLSVAGRQRAGAGSRHPR